MSLHLAAVSHVYRFILCITIQQSIAACPSDWHSIGDNYFYLSKEQVDAKTAAMNCSNFGGFLAEFSDPQTATHLAGLLNDAYTDDLQQVWSFTNGRNFYHSKSGPSLAGWTYTGLTFKLYKQPTRNYQQVINFVVAGTEPDLKSAIHFNNKSKNLGWRSQFVLYGGTGNSAGIKTLYHYANDIYSAKLSYNLSEVNHLKYPIDPIYVPDLKTTIGAKSDVGQSNWFWSNGIKVTDTNYPSSNKDICQQMTLHYNDVLWVLSPELCAEERHYYTCQIPLKIYVMVYHQCNESKLKLSWNGSLFNKVISSSHLIKASVTVTAEKYSQIYETKFISGELNITNLQHQTKYQLNISLSSTDCKTILTKILNIDTGTNIPDPLKSAVVLNKTKRNDETCVIQWEKDTFDRNVLGYVITANTKGTTYIIKKSVSVFNVQTSGSISLLFPTAGLEINKNITFKIQAYSCYGTSNSSDVFGYCINKPTSSTTSSTTSLLSNVNFIIILICAAAAIAVSLVVIGFLMRRRPSQNATSPIIESTTLPQTNIYSYANDQSEHHVAGPSKSNVYVEMNGVSTDGNKIIYQNFGIANENYESIMSSSEQKTSAFDYN